eukprot:2976789-Alexandrium_andersonii.AAC.1
MGSTLVQRGDVQQPALASVAFEGAAAGPSVTAPRAVGHLKHRPCLQGGRYATALPAAWKCWNAQHGSGQPAR